MVLLIGSYILSTPVTPTAFPTEEELVSRMNSAMSRTDIEIQDILFLDDEHVFVPFIVTDDIRGVSYWSWEKDKWILNEIEDRGEPKLWRLDPSDYSTAFLVWNVQPKEYPVEMAFYLIQDRNARGGYAYNSYTPRIQMEETVMVEETSYGILRLPTTWQTVIKEATIGQNLSSSDFFDFYDYHTDSIYVGHLARNLKGEIDYFDTQNYTSSYQFNTIHLDYVQYLNDIDLEIKPKEQ